ncbi:acyl-CoA synthetase [Pseudomonas benzenivorans]|uniref:AMP-binding protein n=1 Tax=Pseudomonas benzenivorans TaxID=556533 RepID=A0ABY5H750_9PSED|nr:AMP-binding protein [Pseudomonas benzenivorans]UTW08142.1 AMP-binding protein [Pseudomonas benzenivorans]
MAEITSVLIRTNVGSYEQMMEEFSWAIPDALNIATEICDRHALARPLATAIIEDVDGRVRNYTFADLKRLSDNLAHAFVELGVARGDRVIVSLGQDVEALLAHLACFKVGAISVPVAGLYSGEGLAFRVNDCEAGLVVTNRTGADKLGDLRLPTVRHVVVTHKQAVGAEVDFDSLLQTSHGDFPVADTRADDPALIFYTSGTTGSPKGALHAHRMANAHLPCVQLGFEMAPQIGDVFWTASDWSWLGSLGDLVFPALYLGHPVVVTPGRFSIERAYQAMQLHNISCPFLATAVLRSMSKEPVPEGASFKVRAIMTGGEAMPPEVLRWAQRTFAAAVNDEFGLTESNQTAVGCTTLYSTPEGSVGRLAPGKKVTIIDAAGSELPAGQHGEIAIWHDSPCNMLGYWNRPEQTANKFIGGWMRTGDQGALDDQGFLYYYGRLDDLILVNGLRVGPEEVEAQILLHPAVAEVAVVGIPDERSGESIVAVVKLQAGAEGGQQLVEQLQALVKRNLAAHCYPKKIIFVDTIPVTSTGKIRRGELRRSLVQQTQVAA